ncbi:Thiol-disulfide isomerase or thioredoxin [Flavobacterium fluvii]|uniref:Thiol-disulfide isomerase or thioredoxin n=1 Tax=Flavobacterium fluvii TaxID=468056 RepID=A0A1M5FHL3_9FLAO|nr:TlpA disulfide reductase family protein [Flavobacterium fluvii]SHF90632.1 Thiol-disulfide isomerase or thioredoxin [Flavobacterium fluvii]
MKKIFLIAILFVCSNASFGQKVNYVTFQAEIANRNNDFITITTLNGQLLKKIELNKKGIFKDTLKIKEGKYRMNDGMETTELYLKNGYSIKLKMDAKQFDESIVYTGTGALENNVLAKRILQDEQYFNTDFMALDEAAFENFKNKKRELDLGLLKDKKLNANFVAMEKANMESNLKGLNDYYQKTKNLNKLNNTVSPSFDYENHKGGKTKLEDFRGKYVYIDVWATWCGPCRAEIPFLKKTEEMYHDKNIVFVSISVDVDKDHDKWKNFVAEKQLGGVQLFADKNWYSDFITSYGINSIPRFILIHPNGTVVKANASRPSSTQLKEELDKLLN